MVLSNTQSSKEEVQKLVALSQANYASQFYDIFYRSHSRGATCGVNPARQSN
jgi:hypothetical protein